MVAQSTAAASEYVMEQYRQLRTMANNEILVDSVEPTWMGRRLYYFIKQDAYYAYDHEHLYRYFGKFRNPTDAKARWRGWLRAGEWM